MRTLLTALAAAAIVATASSASAIEISQGFFHPDFASGTTGSLYYARWDDVGGVTVEMRTLGNRSFGYFELPRGFTEEDLPDGPNGNLVPYSVSPVDVDDCGNDDMCTPYTLTFSQPLEGAGVEFGGVENVSGSSAKAISASFFLEAWSGPNGTGTLLGRVTDPGGPAVESTFFDDYYPEPTATLAITVPGIRSLVFSAETVSDRYRRTYNWGSMSRFTLTLAESVPEPGTAALLTLGLVGLAVRSRHS